MRCLKLVVTAQGGWSSIVFAAVLPLSVACGETDSGGSPGGPSSGGSGATGAGSGGRTVGFAGGGGQATGGSGGDTAWAGDTTTATVPAGYPFGVTTATSACWNAIVPLPPEGTPANPADLCGADAGPSVESGWAARVTLNVNPQDPRTARGHVSIAPELAADVVGLPALSVVESDLTPATVSGVVAASGGAGFDFDLVCNQAPYATQYPLPQRIVFAVSFTVSCGSTTREVRALTALYFCDDGVTSEWASSGDRCIECASICEMVASPILPSPAESSMALGSAVRMAIRVIGRVRDALLLLCEHNGGPDRFDYRWSAAGGQLVWAERDLALWVPPAPTHHTALVQVAALSEDAAAVASWRWSPWA